MANDIKIGVQVSSGGTTDAEIKKAENLKRAFDAAQQSAARLGGTAGSRRVAAMASGGTGAMMSGQEYGQMRGSAGATGASARDFANQAQGLGGLVRLYATFAANIFAVSAAFTALKNAADVENLTKGLNTLGATSGQALGTLSKRLVEVTDGAISAREAMSSVAMTSSAGMSSKNIERLALVAKNASLALGVSMPDALNRLSRGIVKLEPELLDELGLFTKIGPATEKYALELGKSVSSLTDFERRQAFANAVLEEGEKKFNALNEAAANPYDKLLASLKNVATSGLNVVNVALKPIVELLSQSPTALLIGLASVAGVLIKQALPAIGQFKANLQRTAQEASEAAIGKAGDAKAALDLRNKLIESKVEESANAQLATFEKLERQLYDTAAQGQTRRSALWKTLKKDIVDIGDADIAASEKSVKALEARAKKDPRLEQQARLERATLDNLKLVIEKEDELVRLKQKNREEIERNIGATGVYAATQKKAAELQEKATKDAIVSNAAYRASLIGISGGWQLAQEEIKKSNLQLGLVSGSILQIRVAAATLIGLFSTLGSIINRAFAVIGTIAAVFSVLDGIFSTNTKEAQRFSSAIDNAEESVANANRTLDAAKDKEGFSTRTIQNTVAVSNAFNELTDSAKNALKMADEANKKASGWDKFWDGLFSLVNKGREDELAKALAQQVGAAFDLLEREGLQQDFEKAIKKITNVEDIKNVSELTAAIKKLPDAQKGVLKELEISRNVLGNVASVLDSFKNSADGAAKSYKEFIQSLADNSPLIRLGQQTQQAAIDLLKLADQGVGRVMQAFDEMAKDPEKANLFLFNNEDRQQFVKLRLEYQAISQQIKKLEADSVSAAAEVSRLNLVLSGTTPEETSGRQFDFRTASADALRGRQPGMRADEFSGSIAGINQAFNTGTGTFQQALKQYDKIGERVNAFVIQQAEKAFEKGAEYIRKAIEVAGKQAQLTIEKAATAGLTGERRAQAEADLQKRTIQIELEAIQSNIILANSQFNLADELKIANLLQREQNAILKLQSGLDTSQNTVKELANVRADLTYQNAVINGKFGQLGAAQQKAADLERKQREQRTAGLQIAQTKAQAQLAAVDITQARQTSIGRQEDEEKFLAIQARTNQALISRLAVYQSIAGISSEETVRAQTLADTAEFEKKQRREIEIIDQEINRLETDRVKLQSAGGSAQRLKDLDEQLKFTRNIRTETEAAQKAESDLRAVQDRQKNLAATLQSLARQNELLQLNRALEDSRNQSALEFRSQETQLLNELFGLSGRYTLISQYQLDLDKARLDTSRQITSANDAYNKIAADIAEKQATIGDKTRQDYKDLTAELARQQTLRDLQVQRAQEELDAKTKLLEVTRSIRAEQERYNTAQELSVSITDSLKSAFDSIGEKIGKFGESLVQAFIQNEKNSKAILKNAEAQLEARSEADRLPEGSKERIRKEKEYNDLQRQGGQLREKSVRDELRGNIQVISSAKSVFKEKTGAYRALAAIEKAMHIAALIMDAQRLASSIATTAGSIGQSLLGAAAAGKKAIAEAFSAPFPVGFAAGAAMTAIIASLLGKAFGKSGGSIPKGFTAEEQQKVQGTGQQYVGGKLVERQGGVLGDVTLKADSITASLDKLSQEFFGSLGSSSSKIVQALEGIRRNTGDTVKALLGTISGFGMTGSAFGTVESSSKKLGGLWGSASTSIADAGVRISGTLDGLGRAIGQFEQYENVVRTSSSWFGLVKSTSTETNVKRFEESTTKLFANIFKSVQNVLLESAIALEGPTSAAADAIKNIPVQLSVSLKGLTGEQAVEAVLAELSVALNQGAQQIFPFIEQYQRIGEEYYETVARIVKESETLTMGLSMVGIAIQGLGTQARIALEQNLIDQLGGVDKAVSSINFYYENFLTSEERFRIQFNQLTKTFRDAGKTLPQTKQEFINLLSGLDIVNNVEDQKTFALLINNAEKYNDLLELQKDILGDTQQKFKDFAKSLLSFKDSLLLGSATILTPIERYAKAKTEFETLRAKALVSGPEQQEALGKLQEASQSFLNISRELYASGQQYTTDFTSVLEALDAAAGSAQRQADMGQMQLDALNTQIGVLQNIERILTVQESRTATLPTTPTRQEALSVIDRTNETLTTLSTAVDTLSDFVFDTFGNGDQRAGGGYASGMTLVGERGPEFVDFTNPGQVYTAEQTRGMFAPRAASGQAFSAMVSELHELREEVVQLRKEQQKQTGDMIITNYDAQQKVADEIVQAVMQSVQDKSWQDKNKPTIN